MMILPDRIREKLPVGDYSLDSVGCSDAQVMIFEDRVLKIEKDCNVSANEATMMRWLNGRLGAPEIIEAAYEDGNRFLLMTKIPGIYLCDARILDDQELLAEIVAQGLQRMWEIDVTDCPTDRTLNTKFHEIEAGLRSGTVTFDTAHQDGTYGPGGFSSPAMLFDWLEKNRPPEEPVFSHGDYCMPNIFCDGRKMTGIIDIGYSGVADKWVDIEKGLWSMWANTTGQFGGKKREFDRQKLFNALKIEPDDDRLNYYCLLSEFC